MIMGTTPLEIRLENRIERRDMVQRQHEELLAERGDAELTAEDQKHVNLWRETLTELDHEIEQLTGDVENARVAADRVKALHRARLATTDGVDQDGDGVIYRDFVAYAKDQILVRAASSSGELAKVGASWGGQPAIDAARNRLDLLKRTPANTLSSNIEGLTPDQHINQIFQVIDSSRPLVASAQRSTLDRLTLTYPSITTRPVVAVQSAEKTEAGNTGMVIDMETTNATTYLGGGDISWQAAQFSTPNALDLWFRLTASDYALKTEQDAAQVLQHSAFSNNISSTLSSTPTFAQFMTAVGAGYAEVFANSGRLPDTIYMAPDRYGYMLGLTSDAFTQFTQVSGQGVGPLNVVISRGMDSGVIVIGDSEGLLVAENAGAPVELRVVEPAIGGFEVGLIGAFEAVVVDPGSFTMITTAS